MFWRIASKARSVRVPLEGCFLGCTAFLAGGSPRLHEFDLRLLRFPGVWSMAINNAAMVFEPQAFIALDTAMSFNPNIFTNPRIMKLFNYARFDDRIDGKRLCHFPNTLFFDMKDESEMMMSEFCSLEGPLPAWKATFFTALAALYQFGFRTVNLIGCTFDILGYAHQHHGSEKDQQYNERVMKETVDSLKILIPMLSDEGMNVRTCHRKSSLDEICEYVPYDLALSECCLSSTKVDFDGPKHSRHFSG